jgi:polar amino acid transport system substrate-binding protein/cystine transport system substrate-binding protein
MMGPDNKLTGFDIELCTDIAKTLGLEADFVRVDFAATIPGLKANRFDMICSSVARTPARLASPDLFMSGPTIENFTTLVVKSDSQITEVGAAKGHGIGVVRGGQEGKLLQDMFGSDVTVSSYPGTAEELLDLKNGRIDAVAMSFVTASYNVANEPSLKVLSPGFVKEGISPYSFGLVVSRNQPALRDAVDKELDKMRSDGSLDKLKEKWVTAK